MRLCKWSQRNRGLAALLIAAAFIGGIVAASVVVVIRDRDGNEVATVPAPEGSMAEGSIGGADTSLRGFAAPQDQFTNGLRGLIPYPESLPGVGRWQVVSKGPRSFLQHNWKFTWSPDSRFLALGDGDDVRVYSVPDFQLVRLYSGHTGSVVAVDWSPDGKTIASTSIDNTVRLWDAETGVPGPVLVGHRDRVDAVAWHPNCRMLATGGRDATVRLWNIDGTPTHILKEHTGLVTDVAWSRDGERLASLGYHGTLRLWSASGEPQKVISLRGRHQRTVEWSPDGQRLLVARISTPDAVRIWKADGSGGENLKTSEALIGSAAWSPDGAQVAVASWDNKVHLFESDGTVGPTLEGHDGDVFFVEWSPDGSWLASGGGDRSIRLWKTDGTPGPVLKGLRVVADIAWHPNGHRFGVSVQDHSTRVYDASGVVERISNGLGGDFDWSADGKQIVSVGSFRSIQLWNVNEETTGLVLAEYPEAGSIHLAWNPNGQMIASGSGQAPRSMIRFWDPDGTAGAVIDAHRDPIYGLAWNAVGDRLASVGIDQWLRLWTTEGKATGEFNSGHFLTSVSWKPDGTQLITGCDDGTIQIWTSSGKPIQVLKGHDNRAWDVKWSSDGKRIASASRDSTIRLWSEDGSPQAILTGHTGDAKSVDWRPHRGQLLSGGYDATVRLWDTEARRLLWMLVVLPDKQSIKFSPEGRMLAGDPAVFEREFRYILEQPSGAMEIVTPTEFRTRTQQGTTKLTN
ncbi:MAG: WD40 repeat domain-containing protein [Planctomycetaceae bacterium]